MFKFEGGFRKMTIKELLAFLRPFYAAYHWATRPFRAMIIAYGYVFRGEKVTTPMKWSDI